MPIPACVPTRRTLARLYATDTRICSKRPARKQAKLAAKGIFPASASPAATPTMFPSAMPSWKKRVGYLSANAFVLVELARSASSTTMRSSAPTRASARPNEARVASAMSGDLLERALRLLRGRRLPVPRRRALHERHALALDGVRDDEPRPDAARRFRRHRIERLDHLLQVVPVR